MNKEEIIKEYKNYCSDLNIDFKKTSNKNRFIYDYLKHLHNIGKLSYFKDNLGEIQLVILNILKEVN